MAAAEFALLLVVVIPTLLYLVVFVAPKLRLGNALPGPKIASYTYGNLPQIKIGKFHRNLCEWRDKYGKTFQFWMMHRRTVVVTDLADVRFVTVTKNFPKSDLFTSALEPLLRTGLLTVGKENHSVQRRAIASRFNKDLLLQLHSHVATELRALVAKFDAAAESNAILDFDLEITKFTLSVICRAAFGSDIDIQGGTTSGSSDAPPPLPRLVDKALRLSAFHMARPYLHWLGKYGARQLYETVEEIQSFCERMLDARRNESEEQRKARTVDLLDIFMSVPGADDSYVGAEIATFLFAGSETTSNSLAWLVYETILNESVLEQLVSELSTIPMETISCESGRGGAESGGGEALMDFPTFDQVQNELLYTTMVWKETLRRRPVAATGTYRTASEDVLLPGTNVCIQRGTDLLLPPYVMHTDADVWPDPWSFDPLRFTREAIRERNGLAVQTFSSGPRNCVGQMFAHHEALTTICALFRRYKFTLACKPEHIAEHHSLTMRPRALPASGIRMHLPVFVHRR